MSINHWYLHVDLDAFFASVEQLDNPQLRGKPVIVGGKPEDRRSVVSTASYEARAFGVHSAMPTFQAYKLCPQGIFVHGRMQRYAELSHQIMNIFRDYSPDVDQMSIDEAFIDLSGTEKLFGPPQETARNIKARVKAETGLTVSVGLASTKYLAKIASGLSKPDGFCEIKHGDETNFMLSLPLNKVWGLGPKSLELIRKKGLTSTRDIYERDLDTLEFLFGKNMAFFLYNVVRGIEKESFSRETKSHSISAETTFPYDLTDIYTIETELLELAHGVFFRLLKEESYSRTAFVKIRYDDFSTCTVQETVNRNIITLDTFFEIIKRLFEKRYENGRGIRLLGVGFENIVKEEKPFQQELFDINRDEKKQAVEKAILSLSKKHPEIKVSKARTLKNILAAFLAMGMITATPLKAQELQESDNNTTDAPAAVSELELEEPATLFDWDINDKNHVDLTVEGFWDGRFVQNLDFTFANGTAPAFSAAPPVFKQEVELSALLLLNNHWYLEADFADEFKKNTVAAGYKSDGFVRHARIANRGITMPQGYSAEIFGYSVAGGDNQAPGILVNLATSQERLQADFVARYDMTSPKTATFYGMNSVTDTVLELSDFMYGREFRFPSSAASSLNSISGIYIKNSAGTGYKKLTPDEYAILPSKNSLIISIRSGGGIKTEKKVPEILVTFDNPQAVQTIIKAGGSYRDSESFFGKIQQLFSSAQAAAPETEQSSSISQKISLEDYAYPLESEIDGKPALKIQSSEGFSPFICTAFYEAITGSDENGILDVSVISKTTELTDSRFSSVEMPELYTALLDDFIEDKHQYIQIIKNNSSGNADEAEEAFPFASLYPKAYLNSDYKSELYIRIRSYSPQKELNIGKDAAAGSVVVYKNGIVVKDFKYNKNTGTVTITEGVSDTDTIRITWQEDTEDFSGGSVVFGAGVKAKFLPSLTGDLSITGRWPVNNDDERKLENETPQDGFTAVSTGLTFEKEYFKISEKAALGIHKEDTSSPDFQNYISAEFEKKDNVLLVNDFPVLKNVYASVSSLQSTGKLSDPKLSIKTDSRAGATLSGITAGAELSLLQEKITFAGHSVKTDSSIIPVISAEETYRYNILTEQIKKQDSLLLDFSRLYVPLKLSYKAGAEDSFLYGRQNEEAALIWNQLFGNYGAGLSSKLSASQKQNESFTIQTPLDSAQYFEKWQEISRIQFSNGSNTAVNRNEAFNIEISGIIPLNSQGTVSFNPKAVWNLEGKYLKTKEYLFTDGEGLSLLLPFSTGLVESAIEISRNASVSTPLKNEHFLVTDGSYSEDSKEVLTRQNDRKWFYTSAPFYELFDDSLKERVTGEYAGKYEIRFGRRLSNSFADLFLPVSASAAFSRELNNQLDPHSDLWQLKFTLMNASINNFGSTSSAKIFDWFLQEEITSRLTAAIKIPYKKNSDIKYQLNGFVQIMLYIKDKTTLTSIFDATADNTPGWKIKETIIYERPSSTSLISSAVYFLIPDSKQIPFEITRKDSVVLEAGKIETGFSQNYSFEHSVSLKFKKYYSINGGIGGSFIHRQDHAAKISLNINLGARADF